MKTKKYGIYLIIIAVAVLVILWACFSAKSPLVALRIEEGMSREQVYEITGGRGEFLTSSMTVEQFHQFPAGDLTIRYDDGFVKRYEMSVAGIVAGVTLMVLALAAIVFSTYIYYFGIDKRGHRMMKKRLFDIIIAAVLLSVIIVLLPFLKTVLIFDGVNSEYVYSIMGQPTGDLGSGEFIPYWQLPLGWRFSVSFHNNVAQYCRLYIGTVAVWPFLFVAVPLLLLGVYLAVRKKCL